MGVEKHFEKIRELWIPEIKTHARLYRHRSTGARYLSLQNDDENKVFGITFRTPPRDATGVAHILEHSVLCGSRKYPVKEPFVELLKGSLQTFLNAFTYPDKTCYPVASQNVQDFYNLVDVYLDAVFYPRITPLVFQQEGWHLELESPEDPLRYKGVVYNEMKGAYSSPERLILEYSQQVLFPDTPYGVDSGGDPEKIPDLSYEAFVEFHRHHYHPSNAYLYFYGDDDPRRRIEVLHHYLKDFQPKTCPTQVGLQPAFGAPRRVEKVYASGSGEDAKAMLTLNWLLMETVPAADNLAFHVLTFALLGMPASPLRRALIESGLGEDLVGVGLESELRQMYFSTGLKGVAPENLDQVEALILESLECVVDRGLDPGIVEAALNTIEFRLRENNTGSYPRGLAIMLRALTAWLYDQDPLSIIPYEESLRTVKARAKERGYFENLVRFHLLENPHRVVLRLLPDPDLEKRRQARERARLEGIRKSLSPEGVQEIIHQTKRLKEMQMTPDSPEALATIPRLKREDLDFENRKIPCETFTMSGIPSYFHDLFTNGIFYLDLGFDFRCLPGRLLPYLPLFGRCLVEMGTEREDYVSLTKRIRRKTGGIHPQVMAATFRDGQQAKGLLFLRAKSTVERAPELFSIVKDLLLKLRLDDQERFLQMVLEAKARAENRLIPEGHRVISLRLKSPFGPAYWAMERMKGISSVFFLRQLAQRIETAWSGVLEDLEKVRRFLIRRGSMVVNITVDGKAWSGVKDEMGELLSLLPEEDVSDDSWSRDRYPQREAFTVPAQVNYVGTAFSLQDHDYRFHGSHLVACHLLRTSWLWDKIRVQGGAYGAFAALDRFPKIFSMLSYRDPHVVRTLEVFRQAGSFLSGSQMDDEDVTKAVIGVIGDLDRYQLPDAKGFTSMLRHLVGDDEAGRQRMREEILATTRDDLRRFGRILEKAAQEGRIAVLGSEDAIEKACAEGLGAIERIRLL